MSIWMDMTNSMSTWQGGVVGIIRAELEIAKNLHEVNKDIKFCRATEAGYVEIPYHELDWLWNSKKAGDAYIERMGRNKGKKDKKEEIPQGLKSAYDYSEGRMDRLNLLRQMLIQRSPSYCRWLTYTLLTIPYIPLKGLSMTRKSVRDYIKNKKSDKGFVSSNVIYPFKENDLIFCAGWYYYEGIIKEKILSEIRNYIPSLKIAYLVYDMVLLNDNTKALYDGAYAFGKYLSWINANCNAIFFGGNTARTDTFKYFNKNEIDDKDSYIVKFGSDVAKEKDIDFDKFRENNEIEKDYILAVGSVDAKKNYSAVYRAYSMISKEHGKDRLPQLVIVGSKFGDSYVTDCVDKDPDITGRIIFVRPDDDELAALYKNCRFTILPTWYEGWSLTLPESLNYGKFCLASKVAPLIEIGGDLIDYVEPDDIKSWGDKILYYFENPSEVDKYNENIVKNYKKITWNECADQLNKDLIDLNNKKAGELQTELVYDLTTTYLQAVCNGHVSGITRAQLLIAKYIGIKYPNVRFFIINNNKFEYLNKFDIIELFSSKSIDESFNDLKNKWLYKLSTSSKNKNNLPANSQIYWTFVSLLPAGLKKRAINYGNRMKDKRALSTENNTEDFSDKLRDNDIIFSTGTGFMDGVYKVLKKNKDRIKFIQLIYDFTPTLYPQVHTKQTVEFYPKFLKNTYENSYAVCYGGDTARIDGRAYAKNNNLPVCKDFYLKFGCDVLVSNDDNIDIDKVKKEFFERVGIKKDYIIAVGSIELRKNHETLYLAYLDMLSKYDDVPQMIFVGYPGWKTQELISRMNRDDRIRGKIIICTPSDIEKDILYKNCKFTVLASLYEGWSLTLPESLNYGKLCISTKADPMIEIGGDLIDYVEAFDVKGWSDTIMSYYNDESKLSEKESAIKSGWKSISWKESAQDAITNIKNCVGVN